jgi:hypothetical protein
VIVGVATVGRLIARLKEVVVVSPPPVAVTVIVDVPAGVEALVLTLRVVEHVGLHETEENEAVAPEGRPEALKETAWLLPELRVAVTVSVAEEPATTEIFPEFVKLKLKLLALAFENHALASELGVKLPLKALALTSVLAVSTNGFV